MYRVSHRDTKAFLAVVVDPSVEIAAGLPDREVYLYKRGPRTHSCNKKANDEELNYQCPSERKPTWLLYAGTKTVTQTCCLNRVIVGVDSYHCYCPGV